MCCGNGGYFIQPIVVGAMYLEDRLTLRQSGPWRSSQTYENRRGDLLSVQNTAPGVRRVPAAGQDMAKWQCKRPNTFSLAIPTPFPRCGEHDTTPYASNINNGGQSRHQKLCAISILMLATVLRLDHIAPQSPQSNPRPKNMKSR